MSIVLSHKYIAPRSLPHSKAWSCARQSPRIFPVPQYIHQKVKANSFLGTFSRGRESHWGSCFYLTAHSGLSDYRSHAQASKDSRYGSLCQDALTPRRRSLHLHPSHAWRSKCSWEWLNKLDARLNSWSEKETTRELIRHADQSDLDKWKARWKEWKLQGRHKLSKWETHLYEWERQGKAKLSTWQDCCNEDGEYARKQVQLAKEDFEEFMKLVEADPYGILFGWKPPSRGRDDNKNCNQDSSWIESNSPTRKFDIWDSGPGAMSASKCVRKPESKPPSHANSRSSIEEETQVDDFEFDPISMRNVPKNHNNESSILAGKTAYATNHFSVPTEQFVTTAPFEAETLPPTQSSLDETDKTHWSVDALAASRTPTGARQHAQDWLVQEGFGIKKAGLEPSNFGSNPIKPSEIETVLNRHLKTKGLVAKVSAKQPVLIHEAKEKPGENVESLQANELRSSVGLSEIAAVSEQHGKDTKAKDTSSTTAKIYSGAGKDTEPQDTSSTTAKIYIGAGKDIKAKDTSSIAAGAYSGEDPGHRRDPLIDSQKSRKAGPATQDLHGGSRSREQPAHAVEGVEAGISPRDHMIGNGETQLSQQTTKVEQEERESSAQCPDVIGEASATIGDTGLKSPNSKCDSPPTTISTTMSDNNSSSTINHHVEPEERSLPEPSCYKILAFDPATKKVYSTHIFASVMPSNDGRKLGLLEAISILTAPAKFLPHLTALGKSGYELVLASDTVMIFKQAKQTKRSPVEKISVDDEKYPRHINPIDGTMTQAGNFASPTGFVNHNAPVLPQVEDGRPVPLYDYDWSSGKANDTIHWQDKGSSGSRPRWDEHQNARSDGRRTKSSESLSSLTGRFARFMGRCTRNALRIMGKTFIIVVWSLAFVGLCNAAQAAKIA